MKRLARGAAALFLVAFANLAMAEWPERPIKIVVPFPPGNSSDVSMRLVGEKLSTRLGQPVIIENRVGAGGTVGTAYAAKSPADGYTLAMGSTGPVTIAKWLRPDSLPYEPTRDFAVVGPVAWAPQVLIVRKDLPVANFREFVAYGTKPGNAYNYGSSGNGTTPHLVIAQMVYQTKLNAEHIPFQGGAQGLTSLIGGQIDFMSENVPVVQGAIAAGQVKALGVSSAARIPSMPNLPTLKEQGAKDFDLQGWIILMAPKQIPEAVSVKLSGALDAIMKMPDVRQRLNDLGLVPMDMSRTELAGFLFAESEKWKHVVENSGAAQTTR